MLWEICVGLWCVMGVVIYLDDSWVGILPVPCPCPLEGLAKRRSPCFLSPYCCYPQEVVVLPLARTVADWRLNWLSAVVHHCYRLAGRNALLNRCNPRSYWLCVVSSPIWRHRPDGPSPIEAPPCWHWLTIVMLGLRSHRHYQHRPNSFSWKRRVHLRSMSHLILPMVQF